jgi:hypothetical protein
MKVKFHTFWTVSLEEDKWSAPHCSYWIRLLSGLKATVAKGKDPLFPCIRLPAVQYLRPTEFHGLNSGVNGLAVS